MTSQVFRRSDKYVEVAAECGDRPSGRGGLSVTIERLRKSFGQNEVLRGIDLEISAGEFVAVVGRSGCGKSTLLRLLVGLDQPSEGEIRLGDGIEQDARTGAVRIMFQEPRLLPWASVLANVEIGLGPSRACAEDRDRALGALRAVGLGERRDHWPAVLSGGQKQRVALARGVVSHPRLLAFDEPLGALEALTRISMQRLIERVWLEQGFTAIMVTHDVAEAVTLADRILLIEDGKIGLDQRLDLPRPRDRGLPEAAATEGRVLRALFRNAEAGEDR
jgi:sulfonate transport system ATP-binding protein